MRRIRVIPALLLSGAGLVKTVKFKDPTYIGDPINAVKIFNDKEVDELAFLDIAASREGRAPDLERIREIATECFMPFGYGGGITTIEQIGAILGAGVEKVVLGTAAFQSPALVTEAARRFGSQAVVVSVDVRKALLGGERAYVLSGTKKLALAPVAAAQAMERAGAGEILLHSIDREGTSAGYDLDLIRAVSAAVGIPVIGLGGARHVGDLLQAAAAGASAVAAGSLFVYQGPRRAVLISYPSPATLATEVFAHLPAA